MRSDNISHDSQDFQQFANDILTNCPKLPTPKSQILNIYKNYIQAQGIKDKDERLKEKVSQLNQQAVMKEFSSYMHSIFIDLESQLPKVQNDSDLDRLDPIIESNVPTFIFGKDFKISKIKSIALKKQARLQKGKTPGQTQDQFDIFGQNQHKSDFIFGYVFDILHFMSDRYEQYYELQDSTKIENAIYQAFYRYNEQNQRSSLSQRDRQSLPPLVCKEAKNSVVNFEQSQKSEENKPGAFNDLVNILSQKMSGKKDVEEKSSGNEAENKGVIQNIKIGINQISPLELIGGAYLAVGAVYQKGVQKGVSQTLSQSLNYIRGKVITNSNSKQLSAEDQEKALNLVNTILRSHIRHNIALQKGLSSQQFQNVSQILQRRFNEMDRKCLENKFDQQQKDQIISILTGLIEQLKQSDRNHLHIRQIQHFLSGFEKMQPVSRGSYSFSQKKEQVPKQFYAICMLYKCLTRDQKEKFIYTPSARRLLLKICRQLQSRFKRINESRQSKEVEPFSLVHSLKMIQSQGLRRSQFSQFVTNQKPFKESQLPLENEKSIYFKGQSNKNQQQYSIQQTKLKVQQQLHRIHSHVLKKRFKEPPKLELLKLSHSTNKKNITVLISGFLSEDTNKYQQWMGILGSTYDSEIYALKWESKNIESIMEYTISTCRDLALAGGGAKMFGGPYIKAAFILKEVYNKYQQNPFKPTFDMANVTGVFLAHLLIGLFDYHFINLVGFSLGTQVIIATLEELKRCGMLHLINRIVTLGGVVDKKQMLRLLDNAEQPSSGNSSNNYQMSSSQKKPNKLKDFLKQSLPIFGGQQQASSSNSMPQYQKWPVQIAWTNVHCDKDNILRYLLKISMPSIEPVGLREIKMNENQGQSQSQSVQGSGSNLKKSGKSKSKCYQIDNINVSDIINGHLSYRTNMKVIGRLIGIKDE